MRRGQPAFSPVRNGGDLVDRGEPFSAHGRLERESTGTRSGQFGCGRDSGNLRGNLTGRSGRGGFSSDNGDWSRADLGGPVAVGLGHPLSEMGSPLVFPALRGYGRGSLRTLL